MENAKIVRLGLIEGRHDMSKLGLDGFILKSVDDPTNVPRIKRSVNSRIREILIKLGFLEYTCCWRKAYPQWVCEDMDNNAIENCPGCSEVEVRLKVGICFEVYVTGLTVVLVEVINFCSENGFPLCLYHYDRETDSYFPQRVF